MNTPNASPFSVTVDIVDERIARLTFSHPTRRNALSAELLHALDSHLVDLAAQRIPVVILGSGIGQDVWSAGHDLGELADDRDPIAYGKPLEQTLRRVRAYPGVVIAMVSGSAWGGAVDLAMSCDLVVADEQRALRDDAGEHWLALYDERPAAFLQQLADSCTEGDVLQCTATRCRARRAFRRDQPSGRQRRSWKQRRLKWRAESQAKHPWRSRP